ncbi:acetyl-CoA acetyltransferase [Alloalcanivorax mobilis]|uniref:acetyl-CoA acetyltransferase n=1 Tax=Alloalcanivorax mobilis TaxID=2019569 RepID=UPI000C78CC56|nr:acetyl-CoA acetyltransferase [Alloalcanivorax mobilis]
MTREAVIVGVADTPLQNGVLRDGGSVLQVQARAAKAALDEAGLSMAEVDGLLSAGTWGVPGPGSLMTITLGEYLGIRPRFTDSTNIGGAAFEAHLAHAALAIERGYCDVALICYGSTQRSESSRTLGGRAPTLTMQYESPFGMLMPIGGYAMAAMRHMHDYGTTGEQLAEVAVAARAWASLNPAATRREPISVDDVLASPMVSDPLHKLDACLVTDGGGAVVMTSAERARSLNSKPIYVRGFGESHTHWTIAQMPDLTLTTAADTGRRAMSMAGISHDDVDVAQIYASFTITVLLTLEALGFCPRGGAGEFVANGRLAPGGDFPINTNGGGLSCAHPGMYGLYLLVEAVRQLRGECGPRQVRDARIALVNGTGGTLSSTATCVLSRD